MNATLNFDLNDINDKILHRRMLDSDKLAFALHEIVFNLKKKIEWGIESDKFRTQYELLDFIFENIGEILENNKININELTD